MILVLQCSGYRLLVCYVIKLLLLQLRLNELKIKVNGFTFFLPRRLNSKAKEHRVYFFKNTVQVFSCSER